MRASLPMPFATCVMSAPTFSASSAISLMKLSLSERNALAEYLMSSAEARSGRDEGHGRETVRARKKRGRRERLLRDGTVEIRERVDGADVVGTDDGPVRVERVVERRTLAQELGVRRDREAPLGAGAVSRDERAANDRLHPVPAADGDRRFVHDDGELVAEMSPRQRGPRFRDILKSGAPSRPGGVPTAMNTTSAVGTPTA